MNRAIKFRAWEWGHEYTDRPGWMDSPLVWKMNYDPRLYDDECYGEWSQVRLNEALAKGGTADHDVMNPSVFMQFSGFKDKNGMEIYEGDICRVTGGWSGEIPAQRMYGLNSHHFWQEVEDNIEQGAQYEVIGNEYENPELLDAR